VEWHRRTPASVLLTESRSMEERVSNANAVAPRGNCAQLLVLRLQASACCGDVHKLAEEKKPQLEDRIRTMKTMSKALDRLIADCAVSSHPVNECPILSALDQADGVR